MTTNSKSDKTKKVGEAALRSPTSEVVPHPILEVPVDEAAYTGRRGVDWIVFGVTAVIAVGFCCGAS